MSDMVVAKYRFNVFGLGACSGRLAAQTLVLFDLMLTVLRWLPVGSHLGRRIVDREDILPRRDCMFLDCLNEGT